VQLGLLTVAFGDSSLDEVAAWASANGYARLEVACDVLEGFGGDLLAGGLRRECAELAERREYRHGEGALFDQLAGGRLGVLPRYVNLSRKSLCPESLNHPIRHTVAEAAHRLNVVGVGSQGILRSLLCECAIPAGNPLVRHNLDVAAINVRLQDCHQALRLALGNRVALIALDKSVVAFGRSLQGILADVRADLGSAAADEGREFDIVDDRVVTNHRNASR